MGEENNLLLWTKRKNLRRIEDSGSWWKTVLGAEISMSDKKLTNDESIEYRLCFVSIAYICIHIANWT